MRIFHLSDLHIGLRLYSYDLREEQEYVFNKIIEKISEYKPDVVVIAGDVYDRAVPSGDAVEMFDNFVRNLKSVKQDIAIMMISGNHDSTQRIDCYRNILSKQDIYMVGIPPRTSDEYIEKITLNDEYGAVNFYLLPFVRPSVIRNVIKYDDEKSLSYDEALHKLFERENINISERNVIVSHQFYIPNGQNPQNIERSESEVVSVGNIDCVNADVLEPFEYAALGHIHKPMKVGRYNIRYCGTPMAYSVSEAGQEKGILMVDIGEKGKEVDITKIPLIPMRNVRIIEGTFEDVLKQPSEDFVTVVLTDSEEIESFDMQEGIKAVFPKLLEIRRKNTRNIDYDMDISTEDTLKSPYELICSFIPDMDEEEKKIIRDVINEAMEEGNK